MDPRRLQYGETEYGVYGPRYGSSYSGGAISGSGYGRYGERGDDRYGRQGYGQSAWQQEREQQRFDPDYLQWRAERIRELDNDYLRYCEERYKKFSDEFGAWRKSRESVSGQASGANQPASGATGSGTADTNAAARDSLGISRK